jgi:hypothetical protein
VGRYAVRSAQPAVRGPDTRQRVREETRRTRTEASPCLDGGILPQRREGAKKSCSFTAPDNSLLRNSLLKNSEHALRQAQGERKSLLKSGWGSAHAEPVEAWGGVFQRAGNPRFPSEHRIQRLFFALLCASASLR